MKLLAVKDTKDKFVEAINNNRHSIVLYYADWCPHCIFLKPTWNKLHENFKNSRSIQFIQVEHNDMGIIPKKYIKNVMGFPSIQLIKGGKIIAEYNGNRDINSLTEFINYYIKK